MIKKCTLNDLKPLTALAYKLNNEECHNSAFCCSSYESIEKEFRFMLSEDVEHSILGYYIEDELVGMLGLFIGEENRVDCQGPFCYRDYDTIAPQLFQTAWVSFADSGTFVFYFNSKNEECLGLMQTIGATNNGNEMRLCLERKDYKECDQQEKVIPLPESFKEDFVKLHDKIFPGIYISGKGIIKALGNGREVYCIIKDERLVAYGILETFTSGTSTFAEIIAVDENNRRKGYGRAIVNELIKQGFRNSLITNVDLIVDNVNSNAIKLYTSFGFKLKVENLNYEKKK